MYTSRITHTSYYLPEKIVTNDDLSHMIDTNHEWILSRTGICQRRIAANDESASVLAFKAAKNIPNIDDVEMVVIATTTPDYQMPSTAVLVQDLLGLKNACAFDVQAACGGFVYALSIADQFIRTGKYKKVLVIGAETMSRILDWEDRNTCVLFGDGAGAVLLERSQDESGIIDFDLYADGDKMNLVYADPKIKMRGPELYRNAVERLGTCIENMLKKHPKPIDWIVPHQANIRIIKSLSERFNIPMEKIIINIDQCANTSAASIPIALGQAIEQGKIKKNDRVLLEGIGSGLVWGCVLLDF